jgi:ABC-type phosphate/phosphonate transport system permease subunit
MQPAIPTCGPVKPAASPRPQLDARRTYTWMAVVGIVILLIWSAIGTGADLRVFLHRDAWVQMASFIGGLFPPDLSAGFLRRTLWSGVETMP